ncbi:unnamed protein product [Ostreobium quekettii]|uniref:Zeta toxin domain-containing protein n=1 Tax=Ostreobium quekettii TaxID=121088 RepID=A0A8S1IM37_9CHLO|nr:unnamed protein product [Ostreobium quekettii]|eukprot:evm.model.scf_433.5 EVM.evm.TU.scf_433.5   scf_433:67336-80163(-)
MGLLDSRKSPFASAVLKSSGKHRKWVVGTMHDVFDQVWRTMFHEDRHPKDVEMCHDGKPLPFSVYATCRLLDVSPGAPRSRMFEGIRTIAALYLRADVTAMSNCIAAFGLDTLLYSKVPAYALFAKAGSSLQCRSLASKAMVKDLMVLFEGLLVEYFSQGWDNIEVILKANEADLQQSGMVCVWEPTKAAEVEPGNKKGCRKGGDAPMLSSRERAKANWRRAYKVALKQVTLNTLGVQRRFLTMHQMFQELHGTKADPGTEEKRRQPTLLLLGGGMAAGKSTVREIIGHDDFWSKVGPSAVVVEADAIKNQDVVFQALSERLGGDPAISQLVHEYSTSNAEGMLVAAVNGQKDIVFDGTMTWLPFVQQTIAMVRDHEHQYTRGAGWYQDADGNFCEEYWKVCEGAPVDPKDRLPYRIELVGVTCDPALAVGRGIWRKLRTGRGVPVSSQLRSHRLFAQNFETMADLVDTATLYHTGSKLTTFTGNRVEPKVIAHKSAATRGEMLVNPTAWEQFLGLKNINDDATSVPNLLKARKSSSSFGSRGQVGRTFTKQLIHIESGKDVRKALQQASRSESDISLSEKFDCGKA